jgi:hypothetical protein
MICAGLEIEARSCHAAGYDVPRGRAALVLALLQQVLTAASRAMPSLSRSAFVKFYDHARVEGGKE